MKKLGLVSVMFLVLATTACAGEASEDTGIDTEDLASKTGGGTTPPSVGGLTGGTVLPEDATPPTSAFPVAAGWTTFTASADTRKVFVSSSSGDNDNDGLDPARPVATIAHARTLLRDGKPDWMLLKRGDTWRESLAPTSRSWNLSGRSATEPMLISAYGAGTARPVLETGANAGFVVQRLNNAGLHDIAIVGIHFKAHTRIAGSPQYVAGGGGGDGIYWLGSGRNFLVEDCAIEAYTNGVVIQGDTPTAAGVARDVTRVAIRRSLILDSYKIDRTNSEGVYVARAKDFVMEGNVLDHNGWSETVPGAPATIFNHDVYVQVDVEGTLAKDNYFTRAASYGLEAKAGGRNDVVDNVFVDDAQGMEWGVSRGGRIPNPRGGSGRVAGNVVLDGKDLSPANLQGQGIEVGNANTAGLVVEDNIIAHSRSAGPYGRGLLIDTSFPGSIGISRLTMRRNTVVDWPTPLRVHGSVANIGTASIDHNTFVDATTRERSIPLVQLFTGLDTSVTFASNTYFTVSSASQWFYASGRSMNLAAWITASRETGAVSTRPTFVDETRGVTSYMASIGRPATKGAFYAALRTQSKASWNPQLETGALLAHVRAGYARRP